MDVKVEWMAVDDAALSQKVSLAITSGQMPDIMMVPQPDPVVPACGIRPGGRAGRSI